MNAQGDNASLMIAKIRHEFGVAIINEHQQELWKFWNKVQKKSVVDIGESVALQGCYLAVHFTNEYHKNPLTC